MGKYFDESNHIHVSEETEKLIKGLSKDEYEEFIDHCCLLVSTRTHFERIDNLAPVMSKTIEEQIVKFVGRKKETGDRQVVREKFEKEMKERNDSGQFVPRQPTPPPVIEDANTVLDRVAKKKMVENKSLSYGEALSQAQMEYRELAERVAAELSNFRRPLDPVVSSGDASVLLLKFVKGRMKEKGIDYLTALEEVEKENPELTRQVSEELDISRRAHKTASGF